MTIPRWRHLPSNASIILRTAMLSPRTTYKLTSGRHRRPSPKADPIEKLYDMVLGNGGERRRQAIRATAALVVKAEVVESR